MRYQLRYIRIRTGGAFPLPRCGENISGPFEKGTNQQVSGEIWQTFGSIALVNAR